MRTIDPKDFDALAIIQTWEYGQPPVAVKAFTDGNKIYEDRMVILTSGEGSNKMDVVDAIAGEPKVENVPIFADTLISRLKLLLKI